MSEFHNPHQPATTSRREFLGRSAAVAGLAAIGPLSLARGAHAAGSDVIKIGLIGCGGRGSGAAVNAMNAGPDVRLVAMADLFEDRARGSLERLKTLKPDQVQVADDHVFSDFDGYKKVLASDIDVVLIACASHFHPAYLAAAVEAGKHVFCEKPNGLDVPGANMTKAAAEEAKKRNLCVVSGLCWRYDKGVQETIQRIQDGQIGDIVAMQATRMGGPYVLRERQPEWTEVQYQFQNWYHFDWLAGSAPTQTLIHQIDKASWAIGDVAPATAWGLGGRQVCTDPKYGDLYDHQSIVYEYANGVRLYAFSRNIPGCFGEATTVVLGSKGRAFMPSRPAIEGENPWRYEKPEKPVSMTDAEHVALFDAIRAGKTINNGHYMYLTTMLATMGEMVCDTGQQMTWEELLASTHSFSLPEYNWDIKPPVQPGPDGIYPTPMPGITKYA